MNDKQTKARDLFFQTDATKTDIAHAVGIPRRTLHHWIKENNWEIQKLCGDYMPVRITENCYHVMANLTEHLLSDDRKAQPVTHREAETLHKMIMVIGKLKARATLCENLEMMAGFMDHVGHRSPEAAPLILPFVEDYVASRTAISALPATAFQAPRNTPSSAELERERQLDLQDIATWEAEKKQAASTPATTATAEPRIPIRDEATQKRNTGTPSYEDFREDLRRANEDRQHLYATSPIAKPPKAA